MKKKVWITGVAVIALVGLFAFSGGFHSWAMGPGMMGGWGNGWARGGDGVSGGAGRGPGWGRGNPWRGGGCGGICGGWGSSGGSGVSRPKTYASRGPVDRDQAKNIVTNFISRSNPNLKVGQVKDAGTYFDIEILGADGKFFDRLGVEKTSGRIMPIS